VKLEGRKGLEEQVMKKRMVSPRLMRTSVLVLMGTLVLGAVAMWALPTNAMAQHGKGRGNGQLQEQSAAMSSRAALDKADPSYDAQALSRNESEALLIALDDEYKAWSIYEQVIDDFGAVQPFTSIQRAEEHHIAALVRLLRRYDLDVPANGWEGNAPSFESVSDACTASAQAEIDNGALYDKLLEMVDNPTVIRVFEALQRASESRHLPAFQQCAP
jgi:hypothetical protein